MVSSRTIVVAAVAGLALAASCVSTPVSAPNDGQIVMSAVPASVALDEFAASPVTSATVAVTALVLDMNGLPLSGVEVFFSTDGGSLASSALPDPGIETDAAGRAADTLTVVLGDPDSITVTARSGTVSTDFVLTKTEAGPNQPPVATIDATPGNSTFHGSPVLFDGGFSADPDGDTISCYQWEVQYGAGSITPNIPCPSPNSRCEIYQGPQATFISVTFDEPQNPLITLRVSDDPAIACPPGGPATPFAAFNGAAPLLYTVNCGPPSANAGPDPGVVYDLSNNGGSVSVQLSASLSTPRSEIVDYQWDCRNGAGDMPNGEDVTCTYTTAGTRNVTVTVTNYCGATHFDSVRIVVVD